MNFIPARNKLEAVARISQLTNSGPETLGPGSKEHRSVLNNLADGIGLESDQYDSKQAISAAIAKRLGANWTHECESVGQTITLKGLNLLLEAGFRYFNGAITQKENFSSFNDEIISIRKVLDEVTPRFMDGKECVLEMKEAGADNWKQTEWQGWYFEFKTIPALINKLGGGPINIGTTKFDYALVRPWDLKAHSIYGINGPLKPNYNCLLNDKKSIREAVSQIGLGLIVLSGIPKYNDKDFSAWHKNLRGQSGDVRKQLKNGFESKKIEFFFFQDFEDLERAIANGVITEFKQGKQQSGETRAPKYSLQINKARTDKIKKDELNF